MSSARLDAFVRSAQADPSGTLIALDIDGTISEIASTPHEAVVANQGVMRGLARRFPVWCISGRDADVARRLVGVAELGYIGSHGLEAIEGEATQLLVPLPDQHGAIERLVRVVEQTIPQIAPYVERKRWSVAFHYRLVPDVADRLLHALEDHTPAGFSVLRGKAVYEVRPDIGQDKGSAITWLLERTGARRVLAAGDDLTDIPMFVSLSTLDARNRMRVAVRSAAVPEELIANADLTVANVAQLVQLLQQLATT